MATTTILTDTLENSSRSVNAVATEASERSQIFVADEQRAVIALSLDADARHQALVERVAPDFTLPDLGGTARSFSEWGGTKRLLFAWSSW